MGVRTEWKSKTGNIKAGSGGPDLEGQSRYDETLEAWPQ